MLSAVILEDEQKSIDLLSTIVYEYCPQIKLMGSATNHADSIHLIKSNQPQLIFADIQLDGCTSFDVFEALPQTDFRVIFTTAYDQYALKAFDYAAVHYLLKPYSPKTVIQAVARLQDGHIDKSALNRLLSSISTETSKRVEIPTSEGLHFISAEDIVRIQAERAYSKIYLEDGTEITASKPLKQIEVMLSEHHFMRSHDSHLINLNKVKLYEKRDGGSLIMTNRHAVPISRRNKAKLFDHLKKL